MSKVDSNKMIWVLPLNNFQFDGSDGQRQKAVAGKKVQLPADVAKSAISEKLADPAESGE